MSPEASRCFHVLPDESRCSMLVLGEGWLEGCGRVGIQVYIILYVSFCIAYTNVQSRIIFYYPLLYIIACILLDCPFKLMYNIELYSILCCIVFYILVYNWLHVPLVYYFRFPVSFNIMSYSILPAYVLLCSGGFALGSFSFQALQILTTPGVISLHVLLCQYVTYKDPAMSLALQDIYYKAISDGRKTREGRLSTKPLQALKEGSIVQFTTKSDSSQFIQVRVKAAAQYACIADMLVGRLQEYLPGTGTSDEGITIYHRFPWYKARELKAGMTGFSFDIMYTSPPGASHATLSGNC